MSIKNQDTKLKFREISTDDIHSFFDTVMARIEEDKQSMLVGTASEEKAKMFEKYISGDTQAVIEMNWRQSSRAVLHDLFHNYFNDVKQYRTGLKKLAFRFEPTKINVFAIINDNDRSTFNQLILSEAKFLQKFTEKGISIDTLIFEESDLVQIPDNFKEFPAA